MKHLMVMAAGTGGHIFPGLAIADTMRARGWQVSWLGTQRGMEAEIVPRHGLAFDAIDFSGLRGKGVMHTVTGVFKLAAGFLRCRAILRSRAPDVVLGMGGYVTVPGGLMAALLGKPLALMNADAAQRLKIGTLADLVAYAKANPDKLNYGSGGNGSAGHLAGEMFKKEAGISAVHIPFNGGNPAQLALLGGQVDFNFDNLATAAPNIRSGKLKAIAVTTLARSPALPEVPPMADTLKGFAIDTWWGLVAPAATPKDVVARLNQAFVAALNAPETKTRFAALLAEPVATSPEAFGAFMAAERAKYEPVVKASGATVD